ncbi:pleckstrin homology domain-containing family g member 1 [Plakobranchus ocellatus]|uniref:Pleckstrin homology domain-containing family g member 1 n=1 Tax=Plakobranchus ocellatus TaxID=259542 RepID=A0AAV3YYM9_9GAST|nr:pleckstrin homology domain-containing family g member 1 [Plakobranchus ocellatus]
MKKARRRRAASSSSSPLPSRNAGGRKSDGDCQNERLKRQNGVVLNSQDPRDREKPTTDMPMHTEGAVSVMGVNQRYGGCPVRNKDAESPPQSDADVRAELRTEQSHGDFLGGKARGSPPLHLLQTSLAGWEELEKTSRHSLNWDEFFGSSLDLAPSLLNIYDGIIASASKDSENHKNTVESSEDISVNDGYNDDAGTNNPVATSTKQEASQDRNSSCPPLRSACTGKHQLPSISLPPDRPVSMAEAEGLTSASSDRSTRGICESDTQQKKQRPLSMSSGSVPSSSSSPPTTCLAARGKQKQAFLRDGKSNCDLEEDIILEDASDELDRPVIRRCDGHCIKSKHEGSAYKLANTTQARVSESRNSVDSGCVLHGDGSLNQIRSTGSRTIYELDRKKRDNSTPVNDDVDCCESNKSCNCHLYDNMSTSSSDTAGSGSFSYRDEVDSSMSSIREGSATHIAPVSSSSSSSSSITPRLDTHVSYGDGGISSDKDLLSARRSITGLPMSASEGFLNSSSSRRRHPHSPSSLPLGHHYQNYQPLDERLATSPDAASKTLGHFSSVNETGLVTDRQHQGLLYSTPESRLSESMSSHRTDSTSNTSGTSDSHPTIPGSPDSQNSSNASARRSSSFSKSEARKRFFFNYEEHMRQMEDKQDQQEEEKHSLSLPSECLQLFEADTQAGGVSRQTSSLERPANEGDDALVDIDSTNREYKTDVPSEHHIDSTPTVSLRSSAQRSQPPTTSSKSHKSVNKKNEDMSNDSHPSSSLFSPSSPSHHTSSGFSSKAVKKRESSATSGEGKGTSASFGYVTYVQRVVAEILDSERTYIASLEDIIQGYLEPMEKILSSTDASEDLDCLFGNIREIYTFGCEFLADLEKTSLDPVKVAECFVKHNKGFVIYTDYCTNYPRAVEVLTRFMQHPELSELCKERQLALGHGLPLGAYLLRPVQRILKYHLLLQNIVKNSEKEPGSSSRAERGSTSSTLSTGSGTGPCPTSILEQAFQHMTQMASHINEMKRKHEHAVRIQEIQSQLEDYVGEDLTRLGDLVLESTFRVYGAKASRQVFLFERGLLVSKKKEGGMLSCKTFIRCSNLMLVEVIPNEPLSFHTIPFDNPRAQYTLQARNMEQKRRWCQEIKRLILESYKAKIPDNVKSLVMQLGRNHDDDYVTKEALEAVRKNQHTAPEYLEKRRFRRKSGPRLPDFSLLKPQRAKRGKNFA